MSPEQPVMVPSQTCGGSATAGSGRPSREVTRVLVSAVDAAIAVLDPSAPAGPVLESMLTSFTETVSPVQGRIADLAAREPNGPLRIVQGYLGNAFSHAIAGDVHATRSALITARAALACFAEDDGPDHTLWLP
ncbi:hypothetical protein [Actinosynnema sp. NPDC020468]|uniref:hypothetical protein n=1 Tax=Actinosynnema sp. NPDC020468 TaxID=3154488 RepID=UPI0033CD17D0